MSQRLADLVLYHREEDEFSELLLLLRAGRGGGACMCENGAPGRGRGKAGSWPQFLHSQSGIITVEISES